MFARLCVFCFFFFKQKTAYEMRISDWSSDVCSSDLSDVAQNSYARYLHMVETAEKLGFDWVSVSEHHYAPYQMTPNPMIMASAIIQRTSKVRVALLGPLVPLNKIGRAHV